ncbi:hypothetical protein [Spongiactinospora sp. TRM90649]|nr:hypothetical protein [Spongiactinospora sp. TRM90649]MDF5753927.1 hypothetical protein [Spongiactinospora sp. TRM90649]
MRLRGGTRSEQAKRHQRGQIQPSGMTARPAIPSKAEYHSPEMASG